MNAQGRACKGAHAAFIFFRFGIVDSYWNVLKWRNEVVRSCGDIPILICGLGADLPEAKPIAERPPEKAPLPGAPPLPAGAKKWKAASDMVVETQCIRVSCKSGVNVFLPANWLMSTVTGDPAIRCKKDGTEDVVTVAQTDHHSITAHICSTLQGMPSTI